MREGNDEDVEVEEVKAISEVDNETAFSAYQAAVEYCCRREQAFDNDLICESICASRVDKSTNHDDVG
jgi:hypothetical protein